MLSLEDIYRKVRVYLGRPSAGSVTYEMVINAVQGVVQDAVNMAKLSRRSWLTKTARLAIDGTQDSYALPVDDFGSIYNVYTDPLYYTGSAAMTEIEVIAANDLSSFDLGPYTAVQSISQASVSKIAWFYDPATGQVRFRGVPSNGIAYVVVEYMPGQTEAGGLDDRPQLLPAFATEYLPVAAALRVLPFAEWEGKDTAASERIRQNLLDARNPGSLASIERDQKIRYERYLHSPVQAQTSMERTGWGAGRLGRRGA